MVTSKKTGLWRGLTGVMASLLAVMVGCSSIANTWATFINTRLGTSNYEIVTVGESDHDGIYFDSEFTTLADMIAAQQEVAVQLASEGAVLLKNDNNALPLNKGTETVTLWGYNSAHPILGGNIGSSVTAAEGQTNYGIREALAASGFTVNQDMLAFYDNPDMMQYIMSMNMFGNTIPGRALSPAFMPSYKAGATYSVGEIPAEEYGEELLATADGTAAVVVITRDSSEAAEYEPEMVSGLDSDHFSSTVLGLSDNEKAMIELAKAHSSKVIVLLNADNPLEIGELKNDKDVDSILWVGDPGMYGFLGVAQVLAGEVTPSGHLPDTFSTSSISAPAMVNFGLYLFANSSKSENPVLTAQNKGDWYLVESEDIYVGYKYYETRYEDQILGRGNADSASGATNGKAWSYADEMAYPFGYGMSYTTFEQKLESVNVTVGGTGVATVKVTNTGDVAGKSVAQLYVQAPYTVGGLEKSAIQLLDFAKTDVLQPGESTTLTIEFDPQYMASYDEDAQKANGTYGAWSLEQGDYYFAIGNGAHEALNNVLANKLGTTEGLVSITADEAVNAANAIKWTLNNTDIETYSVNVENALQDMDLNNQIENYVEYTTRADWTKGWKEYEGLMPTDEMMVGLTNSTYALTENSDEEVVWGADNGLKLVDMILLDENGEYAGVIDINDEMWDRLMDQVTLAEAAQFIEYGGDDVENIDSIGLPRTYENDGPVGFTYDQVGGYAIRWTEDKANEPTYVSSDDPAALHSMTTMPTEPVVAATFNKELVQREGELFGEQGLWANESAIFGPGLNLHRAPYNARNHEYYSEDSMLTNLMGVAVCKGGKSKGLMMEPKHFAMNHQELNRSGMATYASEQGAREGEYRGFQGCLSQNYAQGLMTAFNRIGSMFSGAHRGSQVQILRNEWGYTGWIVTDMINGPEYMNWMENTFGGGGTCLTTNAYKESEIGSMQSAENLAKIAKDSHFQNLMKKAIKYNAYNLASSNAMNGYTSNTQVVYVTTWWQTALTAAQIVTGVLTAGFAALYVISLLRKKESV